MSIIPDEIQNQVRQVFQALSGPVSLILFTQGEGDTPECGMCQETRQLVEEVAGLSEKIEVQVYDLEKDSGLASQYQIERAPAIAFLGGSPARDYGIRMYGIPSGYEFTSLIQDILLVSRGTSDLSQKTLDVLAKLDAPVHIQVFVTPTCPYCPQAVILGHKLALASNWVTADMVETQEFPQLASRYQVYGVPRTVINDLIHVEGAVPEAALVSELMKVFASPEPEVLP